MAEGGEILEGYICPVCKVDLLSPVKLSEHFQDQHNEDQDVIKSFKDLLGKAKKKILKLDEELLTSDTEQSQPHSNLSAGYRSFDPDPQTIGVSRSHTQYFREVRNTRVERYAAETNKLLIRLDKLLSDLPTDPVKRKGGTVTVNSHEQAVVPWIDDKDVRLCPSCAKTFHMARRKHHCRLCGAVMCHDCTHFLPLAIAKKMTIPSSHHDTPGPSPNTPQSPVNQSVGLLRRSNSNSSLNSVLSLVDSVTGEQHFRLCIHCKQLLDTREKLKESRTAKPILSQFYDRLRAYLSETDELLAQYCKMCNSLNCGESTYHLEDAQRLRVKVLKLAENIDMLSNKIAVLGTKDVDHPPRGKALKLQQTIRSATTTYLKEQLITLPTLPTEQQLNVLRDRRRQEMTNRILQEKRRTLEAQTRVGDVRGKRNSQSPQNSSSPQRSSASPQRSVQVNLDAGWGPETAQMFDSDDPMIQQMNIIRNYIKQARTAHKYDEVSTLEQNLRELQEEYHRQQAETLGDGDS
uniref:FYVE-type domain-containing protein n=1 Tax=Timema cristinae TaxID=61476 RepID=A0A7R9CQ21_TIMCR|nr:unnamed protein product [Timema cristinae]